MYSSESPKIRLPKIMMAHIAPVSPHAPKFSISTFTRKPSNFTFPRFHKIYACTPTGSDKKQPYVQRRDLAMGLAGLVWGLSIGGRDAWGAARRPPAPPPPTEKKDPNVTGLAAKILANKKRKEALKESVAKLRDKGKLIEKTSQ